MTVLKRSACFNQTSEFCQAAQELAHLSRVLTKGEPEMVILTLVALVLGLISSILYIQERLSNMGPKH